MKLSIYLNRYVFVMIIGSNIIGEPGYSVSLQDRLSTKQWLRLAAEVDAEAKRKFCSARVIDR